MYKISHLASTAIILALAGCGGSSTTVTEKGPNGLPYGATGLVADKNQFESISETIRTTGFLASYDESGAFSASAGAASGATVRVSGNNTVRLVLNGTTYTLASADNGLSYTGGGITLIPGFSGGSGTDSVLFFNISDDTGPVYQDAYLVSGFETKPSNMLTGNGIVYTGGAGMSARTTGQDVVIFDDPGDLLLPGDNGDNGSIALTANFGAGTVGGTISAVDSIKTGGGAVPLELTLTGTLSGGGFSGTFTETVDNPEVTFTGGSFTGRFYGPTANDIAGGLSAGVSGAALPDATEAIGFFVGAR